MQVKANSVLSHYTTKELARVLGAEFDGNDIPFVAVSTDTRKIKNKDLFVALKGPNFDGHDYLVQAKDKGAVAAVVEHKVDCDIPQIKVADTLAGLGQMAKARRLSFPGKVIGLTGSNGKTTVKELIANILAESGKVLSTKGNFNNDIGLPLTLLELENTEKFAVIEMGANHSKEILYLSNITQPDVALITNAGSAHLEGFGSLQGVAKAKGEIFSGLTENGTAIINLDDNFSGYWLSLTNQYMQKTFSLFDDKADVFASRIKSVASGNEFVLHIAEKDEVLVNLPLSGQHNVANALAAATVASVCNLSVEQIKSGLESIHVVNGRLTLLIGLQGARVIDDTYNANLDSCKAAIDVLQAQQGTSYFVVGDLFESGDEAERIHQELGAYAKRKQIDQLLAIGELTQHTVNSFGDDACHFKDKNAVLAYLAPRLNENTVVLVKGSRGMKMEELVKGLVE